MSEVRCLRLLLELDRRGTKAAVAASLHFNPSGASQQLAQLEAEVGVPLLERAGRRMRLTEAARVLIDHADAVICTLEQAEADVSALAGQARGTVRVAAFQTAALALVPGALETLAVRPELPVQLTQVEPEPAISGLLARDYDLIIGEEYPGVLLKVSPEVEPVDLCADSMGWPCRSPRTLRRGRPSCATERTVLGSWSRSAACPVPGRQRYAVAPALNRTSGSRFESQDMLLRRELVRRGLAAAFVPALLSRTLGDVLPVGPTPYQRTLFTAVRRCGARHPSVRMVLEALATGAKP